MLGLLLLLVLVAFHHEHGGYAEPVAAVSALLGFGLTVMGTGLLLVDYFVQVTVVRPSLVRVSWTGWP